MSVPRFGRRASALFVLLAAIAIALPAGALAKPPDTFTLQVLDVSDRHGQLDPLSGVGGASTLSTYFKHDRAGHVGPTLTLTAGDDVGATPALSSFFQDVPAIKAERLMGIQVSTLGNHNFDAGLSQLQMQIDMARDKKLGIGAPFDYVSANLKNRNQNIKHVNDYQIFTYNGVQVAVIGVTNEEAPTLNFPGVFGTIEVTDSVAAAMAARTAAAAEGADVFIAITHKGVETFDTSGAPHGPIVDFANAVTGFDLIYGDHTDVQYTGVINGQRVVENRSKGVTYAKTMITIDRLAAHATGVANEFVTPTSAAVTPDAAIETMLAPYRTQLSALLDDPIGVAVTKFARGGNIERRQEVPLGDLIADGMRWRYGTQIAYMNGGGVRAPLPTSYLPADHTLRRETLGYAVGPPYDLVKGDVYTVLPFGNQVLTRTVTGHQLWLMLENGVSKIDGSGNGADGRFPQISGFKFTFRYSIPSGCAGVPWSCVVSRVQSVALTDGTTIPDDGTTYTMATINFINAGGDSYYMLADGQGTTQDLDANVMLAYMQQTGPNFDPASYPAGDRITKIP